LSSLRVQFTSVFIVFGQEADESMRCPEHVLLRTSGGGFCWIHSLHRQILRPRFGTKPPGRRTIDHREVSNTNKRMSSLSEQELFKRLTVGSTISRSLSLCMDQWQIFLKVALFMCLPMAGGARFVGTARSLRNFVQMTAIWLNRDLLCLIRDLLFESRSFV